MKVLERIENDLKTAMLARDEEKVSLLRLLKSALKNAEIEKKEALEEPEVLKVLEKQAKQRRDSITSYREGKREDLAAQEEKELKLIEGYLPEAMSEAEIEKVVDAAITELQVSDISGLGQVMKAVLAKTAGQADGKTVSEMVRKKLS